MGFTLDHVNELYMDVLKEIGNIGAGNATTAIANMIGDRLDMQVPKVLFVEAENICQAICPEEETVIGIFLEVCDDISGSMMFLLRMDSAKYLVSKLMMQEFKVDDQFDEMEMSALQEVGNIIAGSYLSALANLTNLLITPSVPYIAQDMAAAILSVPAVTFGQYGDHALLIETEIGDDKNSIQGYVILMPDEDSYPRILNALGISTES